MGVMVRLFRLLVGMLIVGFLVEPHVLPASGLAAQEDIGQPEIVAARPTATPPGVIVQNRAPPAATPSIPFPIMPVQQCSDPDDVQAPTTAQSEPPPIPLYQQVPWSTGEFVRVTHTNGHGANLRVAPRALARVLRVVPEGELLEIAGADLRVDSVTWGYVWDRQGTTGWIVAHMIAGVGERPGVPPLPPRGPGPEACPESTAGDPILTVLSVEQPWLPANRFITTARGTEFLTVEIQINNTNAEALHFNVLDFEVEMVDNTRRPASLGREPALLVGVIEPEWSVRGWLTFEVPVGSRATRLIWRPALGDSVQVPLPRGR